MSRTGIFPRMPVRFASPRRATLLASLSHVAAADARPRFGPRAVFGILAAPLGRDRPPSPAPVRPCLPPSRRPRPGGPPRPQPCPAPDAAPPHWRWQVRRLGRPVFWPTGFADMSAMWRGAPTPIRASGAVASPTSPPAW